MKLKLQAEWTDDCQGKKDYDGNIISVSTRYWPSRDFRHIGGSLTKPSANCSVVLRYIEDEYITLIDKEFESETFEGVKKMVEEWSQEQMNEIVNLMFKHFNIDPTEQPSEAAAGPRVNLPIEE